MGIFICADEHRFLTLLSSREELGLIPDPGLSGENSVKYSGWLAHEDTGQTRILLYVYPENG
jgi:hypothetical protein